MYQYRIQFNTCYTPLFFVTVEGCDITFCIRALWRTRPSARVLALTLPRPRICRWRRDAIAAVVVVLQPVSCALTRFSALARFHNDKSLVDLTAAAAAADDDDGGGGAIATVFNTRVAFPLQQTAPSLYNRFCMNVESAAPDYYKFVSYFVRRLRWSRGSVLAFGTQVRVFAPGRSEKILSTPSFGGEVKPSVPCRSFTACKRSLNVTCKSLFRQN